MKFTRPFKKLFSPEALKSNLLVDDPDLLVARGKGFVIDRLGSLLPYGHEVEAGLFTIMDDKYLAIESIGYTLEVTPQTGATVEMASQLTSLFSTDLPTATGIQVTLFAEPDIEWATNAYEASRTPAFLAPVEKKETVKTLTHLAHERVQYLKKGLSYPLSRGSHFRVRHFRAWVSVAIPLGDKELFVAIEKAKKERDRHITLLKSQYLYSYTWNSLDLYRTVRAILNAQKSPEELKTKAKPNALDSLSHGLLNPDTRAVIKEDGVELSSSGKEPVLLTGLSVSGYPSDYALALTSRFIGHKAQDIPCPFLVTCAVSMPDFEKTRSKANIMAARAKQIADSELARYLPYLKKRERDYDIVTEEYAENGGLCKITHQVLLLAPEKCAGECIEATISVFKEAHLDLTRDTRMHWQSLMVSLPMTMGPLLAKDVEVAQRQSTKTITNAANFSPFLAEFQGTGPRNGEESLTPLLLLTGQHGQITPVDPFASSGNYNAIIVGTSGAGKSALTNDLITGNLGTGGKTYVIDVGASYKKLCQLLKGQWIEYGHDTHLVINPFELVRDIKEDMGFLLPILVEMASPNEGLSDFAQSVLQAHAIFCLKKAQENNVVATVTDLVNSLSRGLVNPEKNSTPDRRVTDLAVQLSPFARDGAYGRHFDGHSTVNFNNDFIVLELEGLKGRKTLQSVVLLCLIFLITQDLTTGDKHTRKMVVIDEAWDLLSHKHAGTFIQNGYRRARKQNASFITITQSFADYYQNDTARAALENADIRFVLRQKEESLRFMESQKKVAFSPWEMNAIKNIRMREGEYSECLFSTPDTVPALLQIRFDPFSRLLYSSRATDVARVETLMQKGLSVTDAISTILESERA